MKNFCKSKDITNGVKRQPTEQEKILANHISVKGLISRICRELLKLNKNKMQFKKGEELEQSFLQIGYTNDQGELEKMFNITNHWGNVNQNYNEIQSHTHQYGFYLKQNKKPENKKCWQGCGEIRSLYALLMGL